ncbi:hypothetical protein C8R44DRAFT_813143 [Mycena epipterygia]|nr:hypothetical protein C8R44DRAFT_813143 [Mycena epipterygia]
MVKITKFVVNECGGSLGRGLSVISRMYTVFNCDAFIQVRHVICVIYNIPSRTIYLFQYPGEDDHLRAGCL